jgi:hypothetical protein
MTISKSKMDLKKGSRSFSNSLIFFNPVNNCIVQVAFISITLNSQYRKLASTIRSLFETFPSRWIFTEDCIRQFNDTSTLKVIILGAFDPRDFNGATIYDNQTQQNKPANLQDAPTYLNEFLAYD